MKEVQDKLQSNGTGLFGLEIGFLTAEFPSQSDIENKAFPEDKLKF